jgi:hypothetical protein
MQMTAECLSCGAVWSKGEYSKDCKECGGGALERTCMVCGGNCGTVWKRAILDSNDTGEAHWMGSCALPAREQKKNFGKKFMYENTSQPSEDFNPALLTLFKEAGITGIYKVGSLKAQDVDEMLRSVSVRCVLAGNATKETRWILPQELHKLWEQTLRPRMINPAWEGMCYADECRADKNEPIIIFWLVYAPI